MEGFRKLGRKWDLVALNLTRFCLPFEISCPSLSLKKILYQDKLQAKQKKMSRFGGYQQMSMTGYLKIGYLGSERGGL